MRSWAAPSADRGRKPRKQSGPMCLAYGTTAVRQAETIVSSLIPASRPCPIVRPNRPNYLPCSRPRGGGDAAPMPVGIAFPARKQVAMRIGCKASRVCGVSSGKAKGMPDRSRCRGAIRGAAPRPGPAWPPGPRDKFQRRDLRSSPPPPRPESPSRERPRGPAATPY